MLTWVQREHFHELFNWHPFSITCLEKMEPTYDRGNLLPWHLSVKTHIISRGTEVKIKCFLTEGAKKEYGAPACEKRRSRNYHVPGSTGGHKLAGLHEKACKWPIVRHALSAWAGLHAISSSPATTVAAVFQHSQGIQNFSSAFTGMLTIPTYHCPTSCPHRPSLPLISCQCLSYK